MDNFVKYENAENAIQYDDFNPRSVLIYALRNMLKSD